MEYQGAQPTGARLNSPTGKVTIDGQREAYGHVSSLGDAQGGPPAPTYWTEYPSAAQT